MQQQSLDRWQIIFFTTSGILVFEFIVYSLLGSGEEQPWNRSSTDGKLQQQKREEASAEELEQLNNRNNFVH